MPVNINFYTNAIVIEFDDISEKAKAKTRLIRKNDIRPMSEELSGRLSAQVNGIGYCIAAVDHYEDETIDESLKGGVLYIDKIDGAAISTTEELKDRFYEWLSA